MKPNITVSVNPTYLCNFRCDFCYLTPEQLADRTTASVDKISQLLDQIAAQRTISHVDLYGGEISVLPEEYQTNLVDLIQRHCTGAVNVVTNLYRITPLVNEPTVTITVSYDFNARERHETVLRNMKGLNRPFHVLVLATNRVLSMNVDDIINTFNGIPNVRTIEIKPYSSNQANQHNMTHVQYEEFVKKWLSSKVIKRFEFTNQHELDGVLSGTRNSFSDDHVYITPAGRFAVLEFDLNGNEFFQELDCFDQYVEWTFKEKARVFANSHCNTCEYLGRCLTEHIRHVDNVDQSCNGYYKLIEWYKHGQR